MAQLLCSDLSGCPDFRKESMRELQRFITTVGATGVNTSGTGRASVGAGVLVSNVGVVTHAEPSVTHSSAELNPRVFIYQCSAPLGEKDCANPFLARYPPR